MHANRYLLDTHVLIWFQEGNPKIPNQILEIIDDPDKDILFSQASLFEIAIKQNIGKLQHFDASVEEVYSQAISDGFTFVNIQNNHIYSYTKLELLAQHRDPFDRLLIATSIEENATILSADDKFGLYKDVVKVFWS